MDTGESSAPANPSTEEHCHQDSEASPHACNDGWVSMEVEVVDPETGEETVEEALYLCRKCAERS